MNRASPQRLNTPESHSRWIRWVGLIVLGFVSLAFFGWLVWRADRGEVRALDAALMQLLGLAASVGASVLWGRWSALQSTRENLEPFLEAAFLSHGELVSGIDRIEEQLNSLSDEMSDQPLLTKKISLDAARAVVREQSRRASEGSRNWRVLLPKGVTDFEATVKQWRDEKNEFSAVISEVKELTPLSLDLKVILDKLKESKEELAQSSYATLQSQLAGEPRRLLLAGAYEEAANAYSLLINQSPKSHTLYLARARASYAAGNEKGARADVDVAEGLRPGDLAVSRLRELIKSGKPVLSMSVTLPFQEARAEAFKGNGFLSSGDADKALNAYQRAAELGLLEVFVWQDYAMAYLVKGNTLLARQWLAKLDESLMRRFMKVQQEALLTLCAVMDGDQFTEQMEKLKKEKEQCPDFNLEGSPLKFLEKGLAKRASENSNIALVFDLIRKKSLGNPP